MEGWAALILAAGQGTRMKSQRPKVLHSLAGKPMVSHVIDAAQGAGIERCLVVVGWGADHVREALGDTVTYVVQEQQLGTGHAVRAAQASLNDVAQLLVLNGDLPLITAETLTRLVDVHLNSGAALTFLTADFPDARGLGRIARDSKGRVLAIVEEAEADETVLGHHEVNVGAYCFQTAWLWPRLAALSPSARTGETYLTSLIQQAVQEGRATVVKTPRWEEGLGVNDRVQLAHAEAVLRRRICEEHMRNGVTLTDPATTYIDLGVEIGVDTVIYPNTLITGSSRIGAACVIGPNSCLRDTVIGDKCRIIASMLEGARLEDNVEVGPFSHLRPGTYLSRGVHLGNFAEVKNATLGPGVKMGHFSYIGDATVGAEANIGAGTVTCNFDGVEKHRTEIGADAFIGSDTMLIAPVRVGDGAATAAGAVVTKDVPAGYIALGVPARLRQRRHKTPAADSATPVAAGDGGSPAAEPHGERDGNVGQ